MTVWCKSNFESYDQEPTSWSWAVGPMGPAIACKSICDCWPLAEHEFHRWSVGHAVAGASPCKIWRETSVVGQDFQGGLGGTLKPNFCEVWAIFLWFNGSRMFKTLYDKRDRFSHGFGILMCAHVAACAVALAQPGFSRNRSVPGRCQRLRRVEVIGESAKEAWGSWFYDSNSWLSINYQSIL